MWRGERNKRLSRRCSHPFPKLLLAIVFCDRFPGGESYSDLINRLESVIIDMEQHLGPTVVVSHVSVLQVLVSYFRSTPVTECTGIEIPMGTVLKFVPLRGGGWLESHQKLVPEMQEQDHSEESILEWHKLVDVSNDPVK